MIRATTNGVLKSYKSDLMHSFITLNNTRDTVLTQRNFNSFGEDPAAATQAFQLRRSFLRTNSQYAVGESVARKYDVAWATLESVIQDVDNRKSDSALSEIIYAANGSTGAGRVPLGDSMVQMAEGIIQTMNTRYGDNYVFAGADGLNIPIIVHTPIVPEVNADRESVTAIRDFVKTLRNAQKLELLPYHPLGVDKGRASGRVERTFSVPSQQLMKELQSYADL